MVNIPSGVNIPGSDRAIIDIASKISAMPSPCGWGSKTIFAVCVAKPKNNQLPLYVPVAGATVEGELSSMGITIKRVSGYADSNGIISFCISDSIFAVPGIVYYFRVKQYNIDFGNGNSQWSNWRFDKPFMLFEGDMDIPCPVLSPLIGISGFDKLTSSPKIATPQLNPYFPGYGTVPASGTYEIKIDGHLIGTGSVVNGKVDYSYNGNMLDLLSNFPALKTSATIDLIISMGNCTFKNSTNVNLPSLTPPTPQSLPCTGSFVPPDMNSLLSGITTPPTSLFVPIKLTGDKTSVPVDIYVGGTIVARQPTDFTGFDLIRIIKSYYGSGIPNFNSSHTITIKSTATDCNIPPLSISIPALTQVQTALPCTGSFVQPDISSLLSGITTPPITLTIPVKLTGDKTSVPFNIYVDGTLVTKRPAGYTGFDLISVIKNYYGSGTPRFDLPHDVTIKSTATDCNIPDLNISIPAFAQASVTPAGCDSFITTVDAGYPSHPKEITDFLAPFYVYLRGIREVCKADPTNPEFITKLPKGTPGTITLGNLSTNFQLTNNGIIDIDLSKMIDLSSLAGVSLPKVTEPVTEPITKPITEPITKPITEPITEPVVTPSSERVGNYCTITPMVTSFTGMTFYDVYHDTLGKIYSGNTHNQAIYNAKNDDRCTQTATEISSNEYTASQWNSMNAQQMYDAFKNGFKYKSYAGSVFNYECNTCHSNVPPEFEDSRPAGSSVYTYTGFGTSTKSLDEAWRIYIKANGGSP